MDAWRGQRGRGRGGGRGRGRGGRKGGKRRGGTLSRGGGGTPRNQPEAKLRFRELQALENKTSDEIIVHLTSSQCSPATEYLLKQQSAMEGQWIVLIVSIVAKACDCSRKEDLLKLLNLLPGSSFLNLLLRRYLNKLSADSLPPSDVSVFLRNVVKIMNELLRRFPNCYADLPLSDLYCGTMRLSGTGQLADDALVTEVDEIMKLRIKKAEELRKREEEERQKRRNPRRHAGMNDDVDPPDNFRGLSVVPTLEDILNEGRPFLRPNKIDGSYKDVEHYLDVQFRLLREDFVRPLRQGIAQLLERNGTAELSDIQDIRVYNNVCVLEPIYTSNGLRYRIKFDNSKLRHVRWENSKRLIFGSLICLSKDRFESFVLATVADRAPAAIRNGIVDIQFINVYDHESIEEGDVYQMVESTAFFEAYRHVLEGLQEIYPGCLPMQNYIAKCQKEVEPPAYLRNGNQRQVTFDLTPIMKENSYTTARSSSIPLLNLDSWPSAQDLGLDDSQLRALKMALTKEFAVIQGPPGTGKTYIGLKIANVLLHNKMKWDNERTLFHGAQHRPILVVCYTNHALDQFLEGIHQFHSEGIVRVGGRSESEILKACSLSELKHKMRKDKLVPHKIRADLYEAHKMMESTLEELETANKTLENCQRKVLLEDHLHCRANSMTIAQYKSLKQPFDNKGDEHEEKSAIMHWLQLTLNAVNSSQGEEANTVAEADPEARVEVAEAEEEEKDGNENLDVLYEANVMQDQRILDDDDVIVYKSKSAEKADKLTAASALVSNEKGESEWKVQKASRLKRRLEKIMRQELSKTEAMPGERAKTTTGHPVLGISERLRLLSGNHAYGSAARPRRPKIKDGVVLKYILFQHFHPFQHFQYAYRELQSLENVLLKVILERTRKEVTNVWELSLRDRWNLYRLWVMDVRRRCLFTIKCLHLGFQWDVENLKRAKSTLDLEILKKADVIGMTTTGAAKHRDLLYQLRPRITIVEEAAEVLESHIVTSLTPGCQHLILIGDHQQLRPNPTVYDLAKHYNLDVSLFERMVKNGMPFERLRLQHRMRPEISKMLEHIYVNPKLENHESVLNFDNIKGVSRNVFFVDHNESEDFTKEGKSKSNKHEARFMAALCRYLILQGYEREQITVLTAYTGQLFQLKNEMPKDFFGGVRVCAVDNFQGEENDIILLSLVRSNEKGKIGFLQIENRVCVALSRAKKGFFCIGNISLLETKSVLWREIIKDMRERGNVGEALMLACQNHPLNVTHASCAADFQKVPNGGCSVPCATRLDCGHVCHMMCHPVDPEHKEYECQKPCTRKPCALNHKCPKRCYQECGPCMEPLEKILPLCGHIQKVPCYMCEDLSQVECQTPCVKTWPCGHEIATKCHVDPLYTPCKISCGATLNCGHPCTGDDDSCLSGRVHVSCQARCGRTLLCGHNCTKSCAKSCPPCKGNCNNYCKHRKCKKKCDEPCDSCLAECIWGCQHYKCTELCRQLCNRPRCNEPCTKLLPCQHPCIGLCGEICPKKCRECHKDEVKEIYFGNEDKPNVRFVELADCGHVFEVEMMDNWMDQAETTPDGKSVKVQLKLCPKCRVPIRTSLRYGNIVKKIFADVERIKQKILLDKGRLDQKVAILKRKVEEIGQFPKDQEEIKKMLNYPNLTDERINVIDNQIRFLSFLQLLIDSLEYFEADELFQETKEDLESKVEQLRKRVMRFWFIVSGQELEELNEEMYRTQLLIDFRMLKMQLDIQAIRLGVTDTVKVDFIKQAFDSERAIGKKRREQYRGRIERIRREQGLQEPYQAVTREEKELIVKNMGFTQGHWFKCSYGHLYWIKEGGGTMDESKCPECVSRIGGL